MPITDLTGTKWLLKEILVSYFNEDFNVNLDVNGEQVTDIHFSYGDYISLYYDWIFAYSWCVDDGETISDGVWENQSLRTIFITGGTDATNSNLISWLQANATQIQEQSNTFSFGNLPIANMYFGTRQVKKVYLGNTLVWEKAETGYTVTLNCGGGSSYTSGKVYVYDSTYADISSSNLIFSQDSLDLSAYPVTLTVESGHCTVCIDSSGSFIDGKYITSSDFTKTASEGYSGVGEAGEFLIDKNGTIEFGADDWDD